MFKLGNHHAFSTLVALLFVSNNLIKETVGVPAASVTATQADSGTTGNEVAMTFTALDVTNAGVGIDAFSVACTGCDDAYGRITSASAPLTGIIYGLPPSEEITDLLVFAMGPHPGGYSASPAASVCTAPEEVKGVMISIDDWTDSSIKITWDAPTATVKPSYTLKLNGETIGTVAAAATTEFTFDADSTKDADLEWKPATAYDLTIVASADPGCGEQEAEYTGKIFTAKSLASHKTTGNAAILASLLVVLMTKN